MTLPAERTALPIDPNAEIVVPACEDHRITKASPPSLHNGNHPRPYPPGSIRRDFDSSGFWLIEVLILALPMFVAVFCLPQGVHLSLSKLGLVASLQVSLTIFNFIWAGSRALRWKHRQPR